MTASCVFHTILKISLPIYFLYIVLKILIYVRLDCGGEENGNNEQNCGKYKADTQQKKLTLDAAAGLTGVSRSMLAQIEKGEVNPTISVLWKIANGYKSSIHLSGGRKG